ncbi:MAG: zinc metallopeptidase [Rhizobiaceae bacterium]|nr:zinc metallopeptidase [Rhizobiaceae bacterium]
MSIVALIGLSLLFAVIFGPQYWVKRAIAKHSIDRPDLQGTGGELAQHLIERFKIDNAGVEMTDKGDHYDPKDLMVRLLQNNHDGRSITAVAIAAHEVGHAIQHHEGNRMLNLRQLLVKFASVTDTFATVFFFFAPVLGVLVRSPGAFLGFVLLGISLLAIRVIVHLVTLPVEWDASFNKALPILEQGNYLHPDDLPAAREVLKAAALTYVSAALSSLLNLAQWIRILR